jgi:hypothetical protein
MQALRNARFLARLVLAWFALSVGLAVAAPLLNSTDTQLVCSGSGGMKLVNGDAGSTVAGHVLECPLCASFTAPPNPAQHAVQPDSAGADVLHPLVAARIAAITGAPPPARGPPSLS